MKSHLVYPGIPAAGHVAPNGYWHPGGTDGCPKCHPHPLRATPAGPFSTDFYTRGLRPCPLAEGTRIRLLDMPDDPDPIPPGSEGTVFGGTGAQLWVNWDSGRSLALLVGVDTYEVIE